MAATSLRALASTKALLIGERWLAECKSYFNLDAMRKMEDFVAWMNRGGGMHIQDRKSCEELCSDVVTCYTNNDTPMRI